MTDLEPINIPSMDDEAAVIKCCIDGRPGSEKIGRELYANIPAFMRQLVNSWILLSYAVGRVHGIREGSAITTSDKTPLG